MITNWFFWKAFEQAQTYSYQFYLNGLIHFILYQQSNTLSEFLQIIIVGVLGLATYIYVYIGLRVQSEDMK